MPLSTGTPPIPTLAALIEAGWTVPAGTTVAQLPSFMTQLASIVSSMQNAVTPFEDPSQPSAVQAAAAQVASAANKVSADLGVTTPQGYLQTIADAPAMFSAATGLLRAALAAAVVTDVTTNGCSGYTASTVTSFQTSMQFANITSVYDATTVSAIQGLLGTSVTIPPACLPAGNGTQGGGGAGGTTTTPPTGGTTTTTTSSSTTGPSTTAVVGTVAAIGIIGTLAYLMYSSSQQSKSASRAATSLKRLHTTIKSAR